MCPAALNHHPVDRLLHLTRYFVCVPEIMQKLRAQFTRHNQHKFPSFTFTTLLRNS